MRITVELADLITKLISWHPSTILQKAKELSFDPEQACRYYLVYLGRVRMGRSSGVVDAINYLFNHCSVRQVLGTEELALGGQAEVDGGSIVLINNVDGTLRSTATIQKEIGDCLLWGLRYTVTIEEGSEAKIEVADMIFGINTEEHPSWLKTKVFRWDHVRNDFGKIIQKSNLLARRNEPLLVTMFLWDRDVWYIVDDRVVFTLKMGAYDREQWRGANPTFSTWNSRIRVRQVEIFDFNQ